jgi:hypothetical protein
LVRELNNNVIKFEKMRAVTVEKWGIKYDIKNIILHYQNKYIILIIIKQ